MDADYQGYKNDSNMFGGRKRKGRSRFACAVAHAALRLALLTSLAGAEGSDSMSLCGFN